MSTNPPATPQGGQDPTGQPQAQAQPIVFSDRSFIATWMFSWLLGWIGVDRVYLGKNGTGIVKLLTIGGLGIWWLIDLILTLAGVQRDKDGRLLPDYEQNKMIAWIITAAGFGLWILTSAISSAFTGFWQGAGTMMQWWQWQEWTGR